MIRLPVTKEMILDSKTVADEMGGLNNSILAGAGNRSGILGELALASYLGAVKIHNFKFDLIYKDWKIECKIKRRLASPKPFYEGSVALTSSHQNPDFYAFLSLTFERKVVKNGAEHYIGLQDVWFCGVISYEEFKLKSKAFKVGDVDPSNGFKVRTGMRNIRYDELNFEWK